MFKRVRMAKKMEADQCPLTDEWLNNGVCTYNRILVIKSNEILILTTTWLDLENFMLKCIRRQTPKSLAVLLD